MRVLVVDIVHGGDILAKKYLDRGDDVICYDVYGIAQKHIKDDLYRHGIKVVSNTPQGKFDLTVMPTHCDIAFLNGISTGEIRSFSEEVGQFINDDRFRIEVTGVKGKTSTCYLISKMLYDYGKSVLLHSSRGEGPWTKFGHRIDSKASIAPPYIITLPLGPYDVIVCEVSLGGSGKADIACITNLLEDYNIANGKLKQSDAKKDIFCKKVNIVPLNEIGFWSQYCNRLISYSNRVSIVSNPNIGKELKICVDYDGISSVVLNSSYIQMEYIESMNLALEVCWIMKIPRDSVIKSLETFSGVPGRGEILNDAGRIIIRERNPGISHISIDRTLSIISRMNRLEKAIVIIDPVSKKVCDKMDINRIKDVVSKYRVPVIITKGDGIRPKLPEYIDIVIEFIKEGYQ